MFKHISLITGLKFFNLWFFMVIGLVIIAIDSYMAEQARKKQINEPEMAKSSSAKKLLLSQNISLILLFLIGLYIPVQFSYLSAIGLVFYFGGIMLNLFAIHSFKNVHKGIVTTGIYKVSRNPMITGYIFYFIGLNIMGWNFLYFNLAYIAVTILHLVLNLIWTMREEKFLEMRYKKEYLEYKKKTPRFLLF